MAKKRSIAQTAKKTTSIDDSFYHDLVAAIVQVAEQADGQRVIEETVRALASTDRIIQLSTLSQR
jgi:hypothetical protein